MNIRKPTEQDREALQKLLYKFDKQTETYLSPIQIKFRVYKDLQKTIEETVDDYLSESKYLLFVAENNGVLQGYICGEIKASKHRIYDKEGYIGDWYVIKEVQSHGIGKALFDALVEEFKKAACTHLALDTHLENTKAVEIYEHLGFTKRLVTFFKPLKDLP